MNRGSYAVLAILAEARWASMRPRFMNRGSGCHDPILARVKASLQ